MIRLSLLVASFCFLLFVNGCQEKQPENVTPDKHKPEPKVVAPEREVVLPSDPADQSPEDEPANKVIGLTPDRAKEALLKMMRSEDGRKLGWFDGAIPDDMAKMEIEKDEERDGWYRWTGAYHFNPSKAIYMFHVASNPKSKPGFFQAYKGWFVQKDGACFATVPKLVMTGHR
jgi:hypothetical protein